MKTTTADDVKPMGFDLQVLSQRANDIEETASYAVALAQAVARAVDNIVGSEPCDDCDKVRDEKSGTIDSRMSTSIHVINCQLKEISRQLARL